MAPADCRQGKRFVSKARCKGEKINSLHARGFAITGRGTFDKAPLSLTPAFLFVRVNVEINQGFFFTQLTKVVPTEENAQILSEEGRGRV